MSFAEAIKAVTNPNSSGLHCAYCGAEALEDCDLKKHPATWPSFKAKHDRENRVWAIKFMVSGEWP